MSTSIVACDPRAIAALVRANDLAALDRLTRCHGERLLAVARRRCRNDEDAHDAVQDALVSAGTHLQDFQGTGSVEGWVIRMVARACGRLRRGRKNDPSLHETEVDVPDVPETDPEFLTGRAERRPRPHGEAQRGGGVRERFEPERGIVACRGAHRAADGCGGGGWCVRRGRAAKGGMA